MDEQLVDMLFVNLGEAYVPFELIKYINKNVISLKDGTNIQVKNPGVVMNMAQVWNSYISVQYGRDTRNMIEHLIKNGDLDIAEKKPLVNIEWN